MNPHTISNQPQFLLMYLLQSHTKTLVINLSWLFHIMLNRMLP